MASWFSKSKALLGIDVGTADLKVAQISRQGDRFFLDTYGIVNLAAHLDGTATDEVISTTAEVLKKLLKQARVSTKRSAISLPSSAVFTSVIEMPNMGEKDLASAINYEAKKYIPLPVDEVILSWSVIRKQESNQQILLTAVPKRIKDRYVQLFDMAGLDLEVIEIEALALIRALVSDPDKNYVIIDIGAKATSINFIKAGFLQLSRSIGVGGETVTEGLAVALGVTENRAEQFKQDLGLVGAPFLPEAVRPILTRLKNELKQLLAIYQARGVEVHQILFVGGGAGLTGVLDFFQDLGIEVAFGNPLVRVDCPSEVKSIIERHSSKLSVAIGLGMWHE